ncbi:hypothetical protein FIU88_03050 [Halomonas sp. THAF12]|uniref:hypothetical protein n=1 Tax=Halomonas sp. THAF12 TaxID=2587849 RepID=UPI0012696512|nr:hypothetical protein [Halomonas sp. THAF12]QFT83945.1 hypothetical protein FIU88_03050 [Halomonas sp. THAF12]
MKRNATAAITLSALMMLSGSALAAHHEEHEMAPDNGVDSANDVEQGTMEGHNGAMSDEAIVEEGGTDSANDPSQEADTHTEGSIDDDMTTESSVDSANAPED